MSHPLLMNHNFYIARFSSIKCSIFIRSFMILLWLLNILNSETHWERLRTLSNTQVISSVLIGYRNESLFFSWWELSRVHQMDYPIYIQMESSTATSKQAMLWLMVTSRQRQVFIVKYWLPIGQPMKTKISFDILRITMLRKIQIQKTFAGGRWNFFMIRS